MIIHVCTKQVLCATAAAAAVVPFYQSQPTNLERLVRHNVLHGRDGRNHASEVARERKPQQQRLGEPARAIHTHTHTQK